ncbi:hypothetical protein BH24CHL5_BH24CHL5_04010 [soil metagenome]
MGAVDDQRVGRIVRVLRHRRGWRQCDVAQRAGLTQHDISRVERGYAGLMSVVKLRRVAAALDADLVVTVRWRGGEIDRLLDEGHAALVGWVMATLTRMGWEVRPEVSYAIGGERGSVDVLAWHAATRTLLVVEVKTELTSVEETLRRHDAKQRLAAELGAGRFGWAAPSSVCRLLVLPDLSTPRRHVARHAAVLDHAYRLRGAAARAWLRKPDGPVSALVFAPLTRGARGRRGAISRKRVRTPRPSVAGGAEQRGQRANGVYDAPSA